MLGILAASARYSEHAKSAPVRAQVLEATPVAAGVAPQHQAHAKQLRSMWPRIVEVVHCGQRVPLPRPRELQANPHSYDTTRNSWLTLPSEVPSDPKKVTATQPTYCTISNSLQARTSTLERCYDCQSSWTSLPSATQLAVSTRSRAILRPAARGRTSCIAA